MDATEEMGGALQRTEAPPPAADLPARGSAQTEIPSGGRTRQKTSVPARQTWRQAEATRHLTLANLVRDLTNWTPSMPPVSPHRPPFGRNPQVARTLPPSRPRRITAT